MEEPSFFIWLVDDDDSQDVILEDDEDVDVDVAICEALLRPSILSISTIEFFISPRSCLTAFAEVDADLEDDDDEDVISRCCVDEVLAILDKVVVLLLDEEDTLELLLLEAAFKSFFVILYRQFLGNLSRKILYSQGGISLCTRIALSQCTTVKLFLKWQSFPI